MLWERIGLAVSFAALAFWAFTAITFAGLFSVEWFGRAGWWIWFAFPMPFAAYVLIYAYRRWTAPLPGDSNESEDSD